MFKKIAVLLATLLTLLLMPATSALAEQGVLNGDQYTFTDRQGNTVTVPVNSFASYVVDFQHGDPWRSEGDTNTDPRIALGLPDASDGNDSIGDLALGVGGCLVLGFDVAIYDGPGDDVYVFEVGGNVEETRIELSDDLATWYEIGVAEGRTAGLDIAGKVPQGSGFRYVRLTDTGNNPAGGWPGADIDAVCGLSTRALPPDTGGDTASSSARTGDATAGDTAAGDAMPGDATPGDVPQGMPALDGRLDLVGTWQGFYLGQDDGVGVIRRIRVGITECSNGTFVGTLFFETPTNPEGTGEYRITGTVDWGGDVHFQGTGEWVIYNDDFDLIPFDGRLCECGDTINGVVGNDVDRGFFVERLGDSDFGTTGSVATTELTEPTGTSVSGDFGDDGIEGSIDDHPIVWSNYNVGGVKNGAEYAPAITVDVPTRVLSINTYHWNGGQGVLPGEIALVDYTDESNPIVIGTWGAIPRDGYMGAPNVYWDAFCDVTLQPGRTYVVYDSDWQTWSWNEESDGEGFAELRGYPADSAATSIGLG